MSMTDAYLIDSNALIAPYRNYYPFDLVPTFWEQMKYHVEAGNIAILDLVKAEIEKNDDDLGKWLKEINIKNLVQYKNQDIVNSYAEIIKYIEECGCYEINKALDQWNLPAADPWLIAAACVYGYTVVTFELPNNNLSPANQSRKIKIPDVCRPFGIQYCNLYEMMRELSIKLG
ncbi:hypothetical protein MmiAt1_07680 [Methanimicrococcus sp. At1]|uniref:DUF4411 family protein n=1 Tax=Methanimicrococcus hacksteinii TaxID=3028293 RepID=A0ABU3VPB3_9EURY|nr:DUF4411 family protein [Methanimicrococcus sp. At1]MDV0445211.1 hypothetical protein [Methanimicrococcus sp. At1]